MRGLHETAIQRNGHPCDSAPRGLELVGCVAPATMERVGVLAIADNQEVTRQSDAGDLDAESTTDLNGTHAECDRNAGAAFEDAVQVRVTRISVVGTVAT